MSETPGCPSCGHVNAAGSSHCARCNYPVIAEPAPPPPPPTIRPLRPMRPRRPRLQEARQAATLWIVMGVFCAAVVLYVAIQANVERGREPIPGSSPDQQKVANALQAALEKDSTDVQAHVRYADLLFDTGNWAQAIVHYRAAIRRDSTLSTAIVDLGVCCFNLGDGVEAERLFLLALARDPALAQALFNLGIVQEQRRDYDRALQYFHRALQSGPPQGMREAVVQAIQRVQQASGRTPRPLPQGP